MIIPYDVEVLQPEKPYANYVIIAVCSVFCAMICLAGDIPTLLEPLVLDGWNPVGIFGCEFLHAGFLHFLFNMIYLWVFGNAICSKFGNLKYVILFFSCTFFASVLHNALDGEPAVGASGSVNGIIGFYLALYPANKVRCFYFLVVRAGTFRVSGKWLIAFWFLLDLWGALSGSSGVAYWAHIGGFLSGLGLGLLCLKHQWIIMDVVDNPTLLDIIKRRMG